VLRPGERVVLHAGSAEQAELAARRLRAVGFLELEGYLAVWQAMHPECWTERLTPLANS